MALIRIPTRCNQLLAILNPRRSFNHCKTLNMAVSTSNFKRPICPSCSKPLRFCLCTRIQNPGLENKVSVTILQHSIEKKHPLNSVRIVKLGLKNVTVVTVADVNFSAQFVIRLLESGSGFDGLENVDLRRKENQKRKFDDLGGWDSGGENGGPIQDSVLCACNELGSDECISFTIGKHGVISHLDSLWKSQIQEQERPDFDQILASEVAMDALAKGFIVKKVQKRQLIGNINMEENEEFELVVPPGSILVFPSDSSVDVSSLKEMGFQVKNVIVLDGTWAKAKRIYKENPWLRLLPHLKLDVDKLSLYDEVRHQPNAGCLSTIESIVDALKAVGDDTEGLDSLLDVFESMVGDQRRCKNERLSKVTPS